MVESPRGAWRSRGKFGPPRRDLEAKASGSDHPYSGQNTQPKLLSVATNPELLRERAQPGTSAGTSVREVARDGATLVQELGSEAYAHTKTGGLDR